MGDGGGVGVGRRRERESGSDRGGICRGKGKGGLLGRGRAGRGEEGAAGERKGQGGGGGGGERVTARGEGIKGKVCDRGREEEAGKSSRERGSGRDSSKGGELERLGTEAKWREGVGLGGQGEPAFPWQEIRLNPPPPPPPPSLLSSSFQLHPLGGHMQAELAHHLLQGAGGLQVPPGAPSPAVPVSSPPPDGPDGLPPAQARFQKLQVTRCTGVLLTLQSALCNDGNSLLISGRYPYWY